MSFRSLITISVGNVPQTLFLSLSKTSSLFFTAAIFFSIRRPFFFYFFFSPYHSSRIDSVHISDAFFLNRSRNSSPASPPRWNLRNAVRTFRSIPPCDKVRHQAKYPRRFFGYFKGNIQERNSKSSFRNPPREFSLKNRGGRFRENVSIFFVKRNSLSSTTVFLILDSFCLHEKLPRSACLPAYILIAFHPQRIVVFITKQPDVGRSLIRNISTMPH